MWSNRYKKAGAVVVAESFGVTPAQCSNHPFCRTTPRCWPPCGGGGRWAGAGAEGTWGPGGRAGAGSSSGLAAGSWKAASGGDSAGVEAADRRAAEAADSASYRRGRRTAVVGNKADGAVPLMSTAMSDGTVEVSSQAAPRCSARNGTFGV